MSCLHVNGYPLFVLHRANARQRGVAKRNRAAVRIDEITASYGEILGAVFFRVKWKKG